MIYPQVIQLVGSRSWIQTWSSALALIIIFSLESHSLAAEEGNRKNERRKESEQKLLLLIFLRKKECLEKSLQILVISHTF